MPREGITLTTSKLRKSLSLIIVSSIAIITFVYLADTRSNVRDVKRQADLQEISRALMLYYDRFGYYPEPADNDYDGWDASFEPSQHKKDDFISPLFEEEILLGISKDPINNKQYHYRYQRFLAGSYGCEKSFVILQLTNFENEQNSHGSGQCPERNFVGEISNGYTIQIFE